MVGFPAVGAVALVLPGENGFVGSALVAGLTTGGAAPGVAGGLSLRVSAAPVALNENVPGNAGVVPFPSAGEKLTVAANGLGGLLVEDAGVLAPPNVYEADDAVAVAETPAFLDESNGEDAFPPGAVVVTALPNEGVPFDAGAGADPPAVVADAAETPKGLDGLATDPAVALTPVNEGALPDAGSGFDPATELEAAGEEVGCPLRLALGFAPPNENGVVEE